MNKIFKTKRNRLGQSVVCSEMAKSQGKGKGVVGAIELKSFKVSLLTLALGLMGNTAYATTASLVGNATGDNSTAIGNNTYTTSVGGIAVGNGAVATGNNMNSTDFGKLLAENSALTSAVDKAQSDYNNATNALNANQQATASLGQQINDLQNKLDSIKPLIDQKNQLQTQKDNLMPTYNQAKDALDRLSTTGSQNIYLNFTDVMNGMDWSPLKTNSDPNVARNTVASQLQGKIEGAFPELVGNYQLSDYRYIVDAYINRQGTYAGSYNYITTNPNALNNAGVVDKLNNKIYFDTLLQKTPMNDTSFATLDGSKVNGNPVYHQMAGIAGYKIKGWLHDTRPLTNYAALSKYVSPSNNDIISQSVLNAKLLHEVANQTLKQEGVYNPILPPDDYIGYLAPDDNVNEASEINGVSFDDFYNNLSQTKYWENVNIFGLKTKTGTVLSPFDFDVSTKIVRSLQYSIDNQTASLSAIPADTRKYQRDFYQKLQDNYNNIDWNFDKSPINLSAYKQQYDNILAYNKKINDMLDNYDALIAEASKANKDQNVINQLTANFINQRKDILDNAFNKSNYLMAIDLNYDQDTINKFYYADALPKVQAIIQRTNEDLRLYDANNTIVKTITTNAQQVQQNYDTIKKQMDALDKQINAISIPADANSTSDLIKAKQDEKDKLVAAKDALQTDLNNKQKALDEAKQALSVNGLTNLGLRNQAYGDHAFVSGTDSIAMGTNAVVLGDNSVAIGTNNIVTGNKSSVLGQNNIVNSNNAVAIGNNISIPTGYDNSVVLGNDSMPSDTYPTNSVTIKGNTYTFSGRNPVGTVSVGAASKERQITNVAAGRISASSTDAINGSQLYATNQAIENLTVATGNAVQYNDNTKGSVTLGGTGGTTVTNVKNGDVSANSMDAVNGSQLNATNNQINNVNKALTNRIKYIGVKTTDANGSPLPDLANVNGEGATGDYAVAIGSEAKATGKGAVAIGNKNFSTGNFSTAMGKGSVASSDYATAMGLASKASGYNSLAASGGQAKAKNSLAFGVGAVAGSADNSDERAIAIGGNAQALADNTVAIGTGNVVSGVNSGAFGDLNTVSGSGSYAFGNNNTIAQDNAFVFGNGVTTTQANSVVLGNGSTDSAAVPVVNATIRGKTYTFAGSAPVGIVSVGYKGGERQIQNVAAGQITATSTDAINGSQLYAVADAVNNLDAIAVKYDSSTKDTITLSGSNGTTITNVAAGVNGTDAVNKDQLTTGLASKADTTYVDTKNAQQDANILAAKTELVAGNNTTINKATGTNGQSIYTVSSEKSTNSAGSNAVTVVANDMGNNVTDYKVDLSASTKATLADVANKANQADLDKTNQTVAQNQAINDAKNAKQDQAITTNRININTNAVDINTNANKIAKGLNIGGTTGTNNYQLGDAVNIKGDNNITSTTVQGGIQLALNPDLAINSVTTGNTKTDTNGVVVAGGANGTVALSNQGLDNGNNKVVNVANGEISATSKDAVNGSQLHETNQVVAQNKADADAKNVATNARINETNTIVNQNNVNSIARDNQLQNNINTNKDIADAKDAATNTRVDITNQNVATNAANIAKGLNIGGSVGSNNYQLGDAVNIKGDNNITSTTVQGGIQLALNPDLAVNSVTTGNTKTSDTGVVITGGANGTVALSNTGLDNGNNKAINIADGDVTATSKDAVNGSQLYAVDQASKNRDNQLQQGVNAISTDIVKGLNIGGTTGTNNYQLGDAVNIKGDSNITSTTVQGGVQLTLNPDLAVNSVTTGNTKTDTNGVVVAGGANGTVALSNQGLDNGNNKVVNVADGAVTATSKDAVNGSQLHATNQTVDKNNTDSIARDNQLQNNINTNKDIADAKDAATNARVDITNQNVATNAANIAKGLNIGGSVGSNNYQLGDAVNIKGDNNITSTTVQGGIQLALNPDLAVNSVTTGNTKTDTNGVVVAGGANGTVALSNQGLDNGNNKVVNVANGEISATSKDAVNGSQLHETNQVVAQNKADADAKNVATNARINETNTIVNQNNINSIARDNQLQNNINANKDIADAKDAATNARVDITNQNVATNAANITKGLNIGGSVGSNNYQLGDAVNIKGDNNITSTTVQGGIQLALNPDLTVNSVTTGNTKTSDTGVVITGGANGTVALSNTGLDNGNNKVVNVANGEISATSKDAVNGSQLHETNQVIAQNKADADAKNVATNARIDETDTIVNQNNINSIARDNQLQNNINTNKDIADAKDAATNTRVDAVNNTIKKGINFGGTTGSNNYQLGNTISVKGDSNITSKTIDGGVQLGLNPDITVNSVTTGNAKTDTNGLTIVGGKNGKVSLTNTGLDNGNNKITNIANGDISANSKDAINGSQLYQTNVVVGDLAKEAARLDNVKADKAAVDYANAIQDQAINQLGYKIDDMDKSLSAGIAATAALTQAPYVSGKWTYAVGGATYRGQSAVGAELRRTADNGRWSITGGVASGTEHGDTLFRMGVTGVIN